MTSVPPHTLDKTGRSPAPARVKLAVRDVSMTFRSSERSTEVLDHVNLEVRGGELICLLGPSGCGKSTLLNIVAGFLKPTSGNTTPSDTPLSKPAGKERMQRLTRDETGDPRGRHPERENGAGAGYAG